MVAPPINNGISNRAARHLAGYVHHLVERRRNEPGQADHIGIFFARRLEDAFAGNHDAEVDHVEVIALEHDADDVLANVMHVALDRRHHDLAGFGCRAVLLLLNVGSQMRDRLFHHARRFHHLGQEHLAGAEQVADDIHAIHQRALDDVQRPRRPRAALPRYRRR